MDNYPPGQYPGQPQQPGQFGPPPQPGYPQPQPGYPQTQPGYPQLGGFAQPQPGYPQPGGFSQPGLPQPRKSRAGLWIGLIILLVLVAGGGGVFYLMTSSTPNFLNPSTPQKTLNAYCDGWKTSNAQEIYNQFDSAQQAKTSVSAIQRLFDLIKNPLLRLNGVKDCATSNIQQSGSTASATTTVTFGNGKSATETNTLIQENGVWKIDQNKSDGGSPLIN